MCAIETRPVSSTVFQRLGELGIPRASLTVHSHLVIVEHTKESLRIHGYVRGMPEAKLPSSRDEEKLASRSNIVRTGARCNLEW